MTDCQLSSTATLDSDSFSTSSLVHLERRAFCSSSLDGISPAIKSASSYKCDNLYLVFFQDFFRGIIFLRNNLPVFFHSHPVCPAASLFQKFPDSQAWLPGCLLTINDHFLSPFRRSKKGFTKKYTRGGAPLHEPFCVHSQLQSVFCFSVRNLFSVLS